MGTGNQHRSRRGELMAMLHLSRDCLKNGSIAAARNILAVFREFYGEDPGQHPAPLEVRPMKPAGLAAVIAVALLLAAAHAHIHELYAWYWRIFVYTP